MAIAGCTLTGCSHLGPRTIPQDRSDYSSAVGDSWKQQTLLNIVKLRYMDLPIFLDVSQIVSGYSLETSVNAAGRVGSSDSLLGNNATVGASGKFTDKPTITYTPLTGQKFLRSLITPVDPEKVFAMVQAGYAVDFVLGLTTESINGLRNRSTIAGQFREAQPEFLRLLELLRDVQSDGVLGFQVDQDKVTQKSVVIVLRKDDLDPVDARKCEEIRQLLKVPANQDRFRVTYSPVRTKDDELAVTTRSILQMMLAFSTYIDVPPDHLSDQRAVPVPATTQPGEGRMPVAIRSSKTRPTAAFAAVYYRDNWFYIDDRDWRSKRALTAVMFFFTLNENSTPENLPVLTIPAG